MFRIFRINIINRIDRRYRIRPETGFASHLGNNRFVLD